MADSKMEFSLENKLIEMFYRIEYIEKFYRIDLKSSIFKRNRTEENFYINYIK